MTRLYWSLGLIGLALLGGCGGSASSRRSNGDSMDNDAGGEPGASGGTSVGGAKPTNGAPASGGPTKGGHTSEDGGSASGGDMIGAAGGVGDAGAPATLPLPPGCEARARDETDTSCSLNAYCSVQSQITHCGRLPSGHWQCRCEQNPGRTYEIEGAAGLSACAVAAGACGADESELAEETCEVRSDDSGDKDCRMTLACSRKVDVDFAPGAHAWLVREGWAQCGPSESGQSLWCQCTHGEAFNEYDLFADSEKAVCRPVVDFCMSASEPQLDGDERCVLARSTSSNDSCERIEDCSKVMPLAEGVELAKLQHHYGTCVARADGGSDCHCSTPSGSSYNLQVSDAPSDATCTFAATLCAEDVDIVPTSPASCQVSSQTAYGSTSCDGDLSCYQAATVDGQALVAEGRLLVRCARNEPSEPWQCSCASDQTTATFSLGVADASAWEACSQAPAACLERVDLQLGAYGEFLYPPDPLPP